MVGDPEAVAQLIAETVAAMNSPGPNSEQDSDGNMLALPAQVPAPEVQMDSSAEAQACTTGMIAVATSAQSSLHGQNGALDPLQCQRGPSRSRLTTLW